MRVAHRPLLHRVQVTNRSPHRRRFPTRKQTRSFLGDSPVDSRDMAVSSFGFGGRFTIYIDGRFSDILMSDAGWQIYATNPIHPTRDADEGGSAPEIERDVPYSAIDHNSHEFMAEAPQAAAQDPLPIGPKRLPLLARPGPFPPVQVSAPPPRLPPPGDLIVRPISRRCDSWAARPETSASSTAPRLIRMPTGAIRPPFPTSPIADSQGIRAPNPYMVGAIGHRVEPPPWLWRFDWNLRRQYPRGMR